MAAALIALAVVGPLLVWLPVGPVATIALGAVALLGAFHGWGVLLARLAGARLDPALAMAWGAATAVAIGGAMIALHVYDARLIVIGGTAIHSVDLVLRFAVARRDLAPWLGWSCVRFWIVPVAIAAVLVAVHTIAAAGHIAARSFDEDGDVIAQVERVTTTGTLADPIGYPRVSQLGGHVALAALATTFAEPRSARLVDAGVGFVLLLVLVLSRIRPRDAATAIWSSAIILTCGAIVIGGRDLAPVYLPAVLLLALALELDGPAACTAVTAGGLCAIRSELVPVAVVLVAAAWWRGRRPWREDLPRIAILLGATIAVAAPYAIARSLAWHGIDQAAGALQVASHGSAAVRFALAIAVAAVSAPLLLLVVQEIVDARLRWLVVAAACALGAIVARLSGEYPSALHALWPIGFAIGGAIAIALADRPPARTGFIAVVLACVAIREAQTGPLLSRWSWHTFDRMSEVELVRHGAPEAGGYDDLLARIPRGETVAVWVSRPELLVYTQQRILDLRTPRVARLRADGRLDELLAATHARFLLVEDDDAYFARAHTNVFYRWLCPRGMPGCSDALERLALERPTIARRGGVRLLALTP